MSWEGKTLEGGAKSYGELLLESSRTMTLAYWNLQI